MKKVDYDSSIVEIEDLKTQSSSSSGVSKKDLELEIVNKEQELAKEIIKVQPNKMSKRQFLNAVRDIFELIK